MIYGPLNLTTKKAGKLTPGEFVDMYHGYIWRRQQAENMIASLITTWIANSAGKSYKKRIRLQDIFTDGRFKKKFTEEDQEMFDELYGGGEEDG